MIDVGSPVRTRPTHRTPPWCHGVDGVVVAKEGEDEGRLYYHVAVAGEGAKPLVLRLRPDEVDDTRRCPTCRRPL